MNLKIVSGGQTGVDRAGLDAAIELGLPYGGWIPKGRLAEDGAVPERYATMREHDSEKYPKRTKANVRDSDATLILIDALPMSEGTLLTLRTAENLRRSHHVAILSNADVVEDVQKWLASFQSVEREFVLNVAGPRESNAPGIEQRAKMALKQILYGTMSQTEMRV